jgi:hypothetical protein
MVKKKKPKATPKTPKATRGTDEAFLKLIILAPFTLPDKTDKATLLAKGREWQKSVAKRFPTDKQWEALNILGLLILNRFRNITYEEVIAMLNFDLMDSVAGRQLFEMGHKDGLNEGLQKELVSVRDMVVDVLVARFGLVSSEIVEKIRIINQPEQLKSLHGEATRCPNIGIFKDRLS